MNKLNSEFYSTGISLFTFLQEYRVERSLEFLLSSGDSIIIDPDTTTEDGDSSQIPNPLTAHDSLAELAKAVGFDIKAPTVPAEQGISETEVAAVVSSAL